MLKKLLKKKTDNNIIEYLFILMKNKYNLFKKN